MPLSPIISNKSQYKFPGNVVSAYEKMLQETI